MRCAVNWSATSGRLSGLRKHVAARDVDFVGERQRHGVARLGASTSRVGDKDARDGALRPEFGDDDRDRRAPMRPLGIVPAKPRKSRCGRLTHCTGMRNGALRRSSSTSTRFEMLEQMPARDTRACCALTDETLSP